MEHKYVLAYSFKKCGGLEAFTSITIFTKCGGKTSSGGQERYILKTYLELPYQFYYISGMHVLTVKCAASGDRVQCAFVSDRSFSKHLLYATLVMGSNLTLLSCM